MSILIYIILGISLTFNVVKLFSGTSRKRIYDLLLERCFDKKEIITNKRVADRDIIYSTVNILIIFIIFICVFIFN